MKQTTTKEKIATNKKLTDHRAIMLSKDVLRPVLNVIAGTRIPYKVKVEKTGDSQGSQPVIYAVNHFCFADGPIMGRVAKKRSYILAGKQRLGLSDLLYFHLNGVIFVDRKDKEDMLASKKAIRAYLEKGRSVIIFPEGTWNLSENLLMLPMKWGIVDVASEAGVPIVPVVLDYDRESNKCIACFGEKISFDKNCDKAMGIRILRDSLATMRYECMEHKGIYKRSEMNTLEERKMLRYSLREYPKIQWMYEQSCIFRPVYDRSTI